MQSGSQKNDYRRKNTTRAYGTFVEGNTARKLDRVQETVISSTAKEEKKIQRKRETALYMNIGYMLFFTAALVCAAVILISHIRVQSGITLSAKHIADLEAELNDLKLTNDEEYNRAIGSVDLEKIRNIAIGELGMRYAEDGQIINVSGEGSDYVRQLADFEE